MSANTKSRPRPPTPRVEPPAQPDVPESIDTKGAGFDMSPSAASGNGNDVARTLLEKSLSQAKELHSITEVYLQELMAGVAVIGSMREIVGSDTLIKLGGSLAELSSMRALLARDISEAEDMHGFGGSELDAYADTSAGYNTVQQ